MKHSGRNLKRRLYGLTLIGNRLSRIRHYRGHGVHSPFVYNLVRKVFMHKTLFSQEQKALYDSLTALEVPERRAIELQNCMIHCGYTSFSIDNINSCAEFNILTEQFPTDELIRAFEHAQTTGVTLAILAPYLCRERTEQCRNLIANHRSTSVDNGGYILFFNNHLPKQHYRL